MAEEISSSASQPRRRLLSSLLAAGTAGVAGCSSGAIPGVDGGDGGDGDAEPSPTCSGEASIEAGDGDGAWTHHSADAGHAGYVTSSGPTTLERTWRLTPEDLEQWGLDPANGLPRPGMPPLVTDGVLYVGGHSGIFAVDAATGDHRWTVEVRVTRGFPLVLADETIVGVQEDVTGERVGLVGVDPASRSGAWEHRHAVAYPPLAADGTVYSIADQGLLPLDPATGEQLAEPFGADHGTTSGVPAVSDGTVYTTDTRALTALDAETGDRLWSRQLEIFSDDEILSLSRPAVGDGAVLVPKEHSSPGGWDRRGGAPDDSSTREKVSDLNDVLVAFDPESGDRLWSYHFDGAHSTKHPVVAGDVVFVGGLRDARLHDGDRSEGFLVAIDAVEGCRLWEATPFDGGRYPVVGLAGADETLYFAVRGLDGDDPHRFYAIDATDGTVRDRYRLSGPDECSFSAVGDGRVHLPVAVDGASELWTLAASPAREGTDR